MDSEEETDEKFFRRDKEREVQMYLAYRRDSDAQQVEAECYKVQPEKIGKKTTRLVEDDRRTNAADARVREPAGGFARGVYLPHTTGQSTSWSK